MVNISDKDQSTINDVRGFATIITAIFFVITITTSLVIVMSLSYGDSYARRSTFGDIIEQEESLTNTIFVTAFVEETLGVKTLSNNFGKVVYLICGNFKKGFVVISNKTNNSIYRYNSMPGDGVQVNLSSDDDFKIVPNY